MQWTRPLETFLELMVALFFFDILSKPLKEKVEGDVTVFSTEKLAMKEAMNESGL